MDKQVVKSNDVRTALLEADKEDARCQKRGSLMNLASLGWGRWIIAPSTFEAGFCSGICPNPLPKEMHPSNHALLQSLLYSSTVPSVCCSPEHMRSLTLFYHDEYDRLTIKNFDNMLVESCACQ
ncbi:transforming growth factor beta like domain protein [Dictyocaulus viviparus]|uniref:Transforming growth factor beta like domain protein n=1 Tax=Dictyocaulus viviparus TaxID=29172 RepID=A0A0D8XST9_DICVI|nr:transforming growth factor beta like domain protein [Dictyocaulus viviparus]